MRSVLLATFILIVDAAVFKHDLSWKPSRFERMLKRGEWSAFLDYMKKMMEMNPEEFFSSSQTLTDHVYYEYMGNITIGSDKQPFTVVFDTSSASLFVPSMYCKTFCDTKRHFNPSTSETFMDTGKPFVVKYFSGNASGILATDSVALGDATETQLVIPKSYFGVVDTVPQDFQWDPKEGVIGLGFSSLASGSITPPLINAINQGLLSQPIFTTWFNRRAAISEAASGTITYGALDIEHCGDVIAYQQLSIASYFQFKASSFSLGSYSDNKVYQVILDTATSFLCGPQAVVNSLAKAAGAVYDEKNQVFNIDCNNAKEPLKLTIGANIYEIQPENYIIQWDTESCMFAAIPQSFAGFSPDWILGLPFLRQYCVVHDLGRQRVGFAKALSGK